MHKATPASTPTMIAPAAAWVAASRAITMAIGMQRTSKETIKAMEAPITMTNRKSSAEPIRK